MQPKISVIIPIYNAGQHLETCLRSVLSQSMSDLEVICVDDGSTDNSLMIAQRLASEDPRIQILCQSRRSAGAARNAGIRRARGEYLHFLDADDWLDQGIYECAVQRLSQSGAEVCAFQYTLYDDATGRRKRFPCYLDGPERVTTASQEPAFLLYNSVVPWNKLYRRTWLQEHGLQFDEILCANDRAFYFRVLRSGARIAVCICYGVNYRVNNKGSLTGNPRFGHFDCLFSAWESAKSAFQDAETVQQAMLLDTTVINFLEVYYMAPPEWRETIHGKLHSYFASLDVSAIESLPFPCAWISEYQKIKNTASYRDIHPSAAYRFRLLMQKVRVWGLRGCWVKFLAAMGAE